MNLNTRKWLCIGAGFGAGAVLMAALLLGGIAWYSSRPKPWNSDAIKARYASLELTTGLDNLPVMFGYDLENKTATNYTVGDGSGLVVMATLAQGDILSEAFGQSPASSSVSVSGPPFIPPKGVGRITVRVVYDYPSEFTHNDKSNMDKVAKYVGRRLEEISGYALFDKSNDYRIDLPSGWQKIPKYGK